MEPPKKKSHEDKRRGRRVRRGAEQLFSLVLIKCGRCSKGQGSTKERKITLKKKKKKLGCVMADGVHEALKVL